MINRTRIVVLTATLVVAACQSAPAPQPHADPADNADDQPTYPESGPPLRECLDFEPSRGEICRLTPHDEGEVRIRVRFPDTTKVESPTPVPEDLVRFRFLGRLDDYAACVIPAVRQSWTGRVDTAIKAILVGSRFEHVTMAPAGMPEETTACFVALTRRLRVTRAPGEDARITQAATVHVERLDDTTKAAR
jgi:hypothetical protein